MANPEYTEVGFDGSMPSGAALSSTMGWVGAACSVALIAGIGWWGYDVARRDAYGVPVIAALEGPARVPSEDPGGFQAANQGLSVNRNSSRADDVQVDVLTLAPEALSLEEEDVPIAILQPRTQGQEVRDAVTNALQDAGVAPATFAPTTPVEEAAASSATAPEPGIYGVPRPRPRPDSGVVSRAAPVLEANAPRVPLDIAPGDIPAGTRLVQLGAFASENMALTQWDVAMDRFGPFFQGKSRVIERAELNGKVYYRLRVHGFADSADARRFCAALEAERADCIPVTVR